MMCRLEQTGTARAAIRRGVLWVLVGIVALSTGGCMYLRLEKGVASYAMLPNPGSRIGVRLGGAGEGPARALLIEDPHLALTSRLDMIDAADTAIDAQYFIWQNDATGILVVEKLLAAADRGVRVRVLLDDVQISGLVDRLSALDDHPNIEIRIFNPFSVRLRLGLGLFRLAEFAIDGNRLNHRMHNKLFVADNQLAMLGGRNIGDDYFGASPERNFIDTDILLCGDVVPELSAGFDAYWNSEWAYPVDALVSWSFGSATLVSVRERIHRRLAEHAELGALRGPASLDSIDQLLEGPKLAGASVVMDDPNVRRFDRADEIAADLTAVALTAQHEVLIVTPYLIPTAKLLDIARTLLDRGVEITVLTNSLASNDVVIAQAGYARYRKMLLDAGVRLFEMRGDPEITRNDIAPNHALHSKYLIFDDETVFIGSLNLDPRSLYLNTELGVVLESSELADELRASFETWIEPQNAWRLMSTDYGLQWESSAGVRASDPAKGRWQRFRFRILSLLPLSSQL